MPRRPHPNVDLSCPHCGYNLRGRSVHEGRCPKCGERFLIDALFSSEFRSPRSQRRRRVALIAAAFALLIGTALLVVTTTGCVRFFILTIIIAVAGILWHRQQAL